MRVKKNTTLLIGLGAAGVMAAAAMAAAPPAKPLPDVLPSLSSLGISSAVPGSWIPIRLVYRNAGKEGVDEPVKLEFSLSAAGQPKKILRYEYGEQTVTPLRIAPGESRTSGIVALEIPSDAPIGVDNVCVALYPGNKLKTPAKKNNESCFSVRVAFLARRAPAPRPTPSASPSAAASPVVPSPAASSPLVPSSASPLASPTASPTSQPSATASPRPSASPRPPA